MLLCVVHSYRYQYLCILRWSHGHRVIALFIPTKRIRRLFKFARLAHAKMHTWRHCIECKCVYTSGAPKAIMYCTDLVLRMMQTCVAIWFLKDKCRRVINATNIQTIRIEVWFAIFVRKFYAKFEAIAVLPCYHEGCTEFLNLYRSNSKSFVPDCIYGTHIHKFNLLV